MNKLLVKDLAAVLCGFICALLCFSLLLRFQGFDTTKGAVKYENYNRRPILTNK